MDVCVAEAVGNYLEAEGHDVARVKDRDPRMSDLRILEWAVEDSAVIVTNDKDFGRHVVGEGAQHCGLVRLPNARPQALVSLFERILERHDDDLQADAIITASVRRIRIRKPRS